MKNKNKNLKLILIISGICLIIFISMYDLIKNETKVNPIKEEEMANFIESEEEPILTEEEVIPILVDIKGAVHKEGVYTAEVGMRVKDIVSMAGGFTEDAELKQVNLAQRVEDEMVIYVPYVGEEIEIDASSLTQNKDGMISLNKAPLEELETLTGIGPSKAAAIISYREEFGPFKQIEDLLLVSGIGQKTFEKIKDKLKLN